MEKETNIFPKIDLFPRITKLTHFLFSHHEEPNRGGGPFLDRAEIPEYTQLMLDYSTNEE